MGSFQAKQTSTNIKCPREIQSHHTFEQEKMLFVLKEAEWKIERKRLRDQVKEFSRQLEEKELKIRVLMMDEEFLGDIYQNDRKMLKTNYLLECMREERSRRDEAVDKWKRLYLAIRTELDHVIKMTHQEERMTWRLGEANLINDLYRELEAKEDFIQMLREQLASKEREKTRMERETDIVKQSLRIMTHRRKGKSNAMHPNKK